MTIAIFALMAIFLAMNIPVAFALGLTSLAFLVIATKVPLVVIAQRLYLGADSFTLLAVPLFILAGTLMGYTRLADKLVKFSIALVGFMRGGLAAVNVVSSMFFAGVSGTCMADTAAIGGVMIPAMIEKGYKRDFTAAVTACSSTIGIIIPPSVPMVLYGVYFGLSVTTLFIAGIIPGILVGLAQILIGYILSLRHGYKAEGTFSLGNILHAFVDAIPALIMPAIILGGIMSGIFTPTEAAAVAAIYVLAVGLAYRELSLSKLRQALAQSIVMTGQVMIIIAVSALLGWVFAYEQIPQKLVEPFLSLTGNPTVFLWIVSIVLIIAGTFLHGTAMLVIVVPLLYPTAVQLGINPIQLAMVVILCWGIGQQTPPVGSALYICCALAKVDMWEITRANLPFMLSLLGVLALVIHFPGIVYFVPRLVGLM